MRIGRKAGEMGPVLDRRRLGRGEIELGKPAARSSSRALIVSGLQYDREEKEGKRENVQIQLLLLLNDLAR